MMVLSYLSVFYISIVVRICSSATIKPTAALLENYNENIHGDDNDEFNPHSTTDRERERIAEETAENNAARVGDIIEGDIRLPLNLKAVGKQGFKNVASAEKRDGLTNPKMMWDGKLIPYI